MGCIACRGRGQRATTIAHDVTLGLWCTTDYRVLSAVRSGSQFPMACRRGRWQYVPRRLPLVTCTPHKLHLRSGSATPQKEKVGISGHDLSLNENLFFLLEFQRKTCFCHPDTQPTPTVIIRRTGTAGRTGVVVLVSHTQFQVRTGNRQRRRSGPPGQS